MSRSIVFTLGLVGLIGAGVVGWFAFLPNVQSADKPFSVRLPQGTTFDAALDSLESAGAVRSMTSLKTFGALTGWGDQVKPGHYFIEPGMGNWAMLDKIRKGLQDPIQITIPGGLTPERFGRVLQRVLGTDSSEVVAALADPALAEQLGTTTAQLLGHMRANTYEILWTTDARRAISRIHEWHERYWTPEKVAKAKALGMTPDQVIAMASIVQWEAQQPEERKRVAGVYMNRYLGRTAAGKMRLQADPTVQYALMDLGEPGMRRLLFRDYDTPHPYNTYQIDGLPPGPINNPEDDTIEAVLDFEKHDFLYFVADGSGGHDFSRTAAEHSAKARRWSQWLSEQVAIRRARERAAADSAGG